MDENNLNTINSVNTGNSEAYPHNPNTNLKSYLAKIKNKNLKIYSDDINFIDHIFSKIKNKMNNYIKPNLILNTPSNIDIEQNNKMNNININSTTNKTTKSEHKRTQSLFSPNQNNHSNNQLISNNSTATNFYTKKTFGVTPTSLTAQTPLSPLSSTHTKKLSLKPSLNFKDINKNFNKRRNLEDPDLIIDNETLKKLKKEKDKIDAENSKLKRSHLFTAAKNKFNSYVKEDIYKHKPLRMVNSQKVINNIPKEIRKADARSLNKLLINDFLMGDFDHFVQSSK